MNTFKLIKLSCSTLFVAFITFASVCHASVTENKATNESPGTTTNLTEKKQIVVVPNIADVIPLASKLTGRLADLENRVKGIRDIAVVEKRYAEIETALQGPADQLERFKESDSYMYLNPADMYQNLLELREEIREENSVFDRVSEPLHGTIRQLGELRNEWRTEKELWEKWQSSMVTDGEFSQLESIFKQAHVTIDSAIDIVHSQLDTMLTLQKKTGKITEKTSFLMAGVDGLILNIRRDALLNTSPSMFSFQYFSHFDSGLWPAVQRGFSEISLPDSRYFARQGWIIIVQALLSFFVIFNIYRKRRLVRESKRWHYLAGRPFSAGMLIGCMAILFYYALEGGPAVLKLANLIVGGIAFARLASGLLEEPLERQLTSGAIILLIVIRFIYLFNVPLPLARLFIFSTALIGIFFCLHWIKADSLSKQSRVYTWLLGIVSLVFAIIVIAELRGKVAFAAYIFESLIYTIVTLAIFKLLMFLVHGCLEGLFRSTHLLRMSAGDIDKTEINIGKIANFVDLLICVFVLIPYFMMIWRGYDNLKDAMQGFLAFGFNVGSQRFSVSLLIISVCIFYLSFILSWIFQKMLIDKVIIRRPLGKGVRLSMARLFHYVIIVIGFMVALATIGFEITQLTIILSALSVGIGFGLQNVVNNFISGLIILFERPVRVGDIIELGDKWAEVKSIGLRATIVQTVDQADMIIPNADLTSNQVTNWTLSNRNVRITVAVGVAYGSDVSLVMEKLLKSANAVPLVATTPAPQVVFMNFGESSLDFELRVWILDADERLTARSELHEGIDENLRDAGIEISFPQRDLHIRSVDESVILKPCT